MSIRRPHVVFALVFLTACGGGDGPIVPPDNGGTPTIASVTVSPAGVTIAIGATQLFTAAIRDSNGSNVTSAIVAWSSADDAVATVSSNGLATGVGQGTAAITATVSGVSGFQSLTVEIFECAARQTVQIDPGGSATYEATDCLLLPAGVSGDRYRVAVIRPSESENATNVTTLTLTATAIGSSFNAVAPTSTPALTPAQVLPRIDGTIFVESFERRQQMRAAHIQQRQREREMGFSRETLLLSRPMLAPSLQADPPATREINNTLTCSGAKTPHTLVAFNDDLAIYREDASDALDVPSANIMLDYYSSYVRDMLVEYWGPMPDVDGNGRILLATSDTLPQNSIAWVFAGDTQDATACPTGNQAEITFFQSSFFNKMANATPNWAALGTVAHEAKHIIGFFNRAAGGLGDDPTWLDEGAATLSDEMSSRTAWAATGGPAVTATITGADIINAVVANDFNVPKEVWGITDRIAGIIIQLSNHPNSFTSNPTGSVAEHNFYQGSWHLHRFLGDAYGNASGGDGGAFFTSFLAPSATPGTAGLTALTGQTLEQLFVELVTAMSLDETGAPEPLRRFTTYDLVSATDIYAGPPILAPPGNYPWPVTITSEENQSAGFVTATYSGVMGIAGIRIHDFLSSGAGDGLQLEFDLVAPAKVVVTRLR